MQLRAASTQSLRAAMMQWVKAAAIAMAVAAAPSAAAAQESLGAARELYASAAYDEALVVLDRLLGRAERDDERQAIEQYRAFCLLALGRAQDAEQAMAAAVAAAPRYQPSDVEASPRIRAAFAEVRRRVLPEIVQQRYAEAKAAFDRKDYRGAADSFGQLLAMMDDPAIAPLAAQPPLADVRTLAAGFRDLSLKAVAPPPPPDLPFAPAPGLLPLVSVVIPSLVYGPDDEQVSPPVPVRQALPRIALPRTARIPTQGSIEVLISETGDVEAAVMKVAIDRTYDVVAEEAAKEWKYQPARLQGRPVKYRKIVQIEVKP
jgi:hypothetical protein